MKLLFDLDGHDYEPDWKRYVRNSSRGIIIRNGLIGMVHSTKFDYYKFPGGGIEKGESRVEALIREVAEEAGLVVLRSTIRPYGYVHRIQKSNKGGIFVQDNYYYFCKTARTPCSRHLDEYEKKEGFTFSFVDPRVAIATNREKPHGPKDRTMLEREAAVLELLINDGYTPDSIAETASINKYFIKKYINGAKQFGEEFLCDMIMSTAEIDLGIKQSRLNEANALDNYILTGLHKITLKN